jgi:hypothetical protein
VNPLAVKAGGLPELENPNIHGQHKSCSGNPRPLVMLTVLLLLLSSISRDEAEYHLKLPQKNGIVVTL